MARHMAPTTPVAHTKSKLDPETRPTTDATIIRTDPTAIRAIGSFGFNRMTYYGSTSESPCRW